MPTDTAKRLPVRDTVNMKVALVAVQTIRTPQPCYRVIFRINLHNTGNLSVRLMGRKWTMRDTSGQTKIVEAAQLFNNEPILTPGAVFSFSGQQEFSRPPRRMVLRLFGKDQAGRPFITPPLRLPLTPQEADEVQE